MKMEVESMFKGVNHIGIGVSDMDNSIKFYGENLGFTKIMFDYTGYIPGIEKMTNKTETEGRVVMLKNKNISPMGLGMIKLVQLIPPGSASKMPEGMYWGEIGVSEICLHGHRVPEIFYDIVIEKGCKALMPAISCTLPPYDTNVDLCYIADPDGGKIEILEWKDIWSGIRTEPAVEGVNHVAFGVSNIEKSTAYYKSLGFTETLFDFDGYFDAFAIWFPKLVKMKERILANYHGASIELVEQTPPSEDLKGEWGRIGPMEFSIEVDNIDTAFEFLHNNGINFVCPPQTIKVPSGEWKYAYIVEPDNLYVSLIEQRF